MMSPLLILVISVALIAGLQPVFAQEVITVNSTTPCFMNATAGIHMIQNCLNHNGTSSTDIISLSLLPFEWITGGYFSMILVGLLILGVYIKYQKAIYAVAIGVVFIPIAFQFFPGAWWGFVIILVVMGITGGIIWMIREQIR